MENRIHVPLQPGKTKRKGLFISGSLPGLFLMLSAVGMNTNTVGELLLKIFCILSGGMVVFISFKAYQKPGSTRFLGADMTMVFTGFLILAIGSRAYDISKEFQPAHLYFLTAFLMIFKGVMFPDAKIKRGFLVGSKDVLFKKRAFGQSVVIPETCLAKITVNKEDLTFASPSGEQMNIDLTGYENLNETCAALIAAVAATRADESEED